MLWKVVGAALLMIGIALFAQLDQWPDMRGPRVMASAFLFFGLLVYAKGTEESIVTALREIDKPPSKSA